MDDEIKQQGSVRILSREYWRDAAKLLSNTRVLTYAAMIIALRVAVKLWRIPIADGLFLTFDCYVNAIGSIVYGPVVALLVGAVSDSLGCIIAPSGPYFFPFIVVEMSSSFIFALFLWRQKLGPYRVLLSKFSVNFVSNIILTSLIMKWNYAVVYGSEKAYTFINAVRIVKNLITFPIESMLICIILGALIKPLKILKLIRPDQEEMKFDTKHIVTIAVLTLLSIALILFYIFFLKDYLDAHNIKLL